MQEIPPAKVVPVKNGKAAAKAPVEESSEEEDSDEDSEEEVKVLFLFVSSSFSCCDNRACSICGYQVHAI